MINCAYVRFPQTIPHFHEFFPDFLSVFRLRVVKRNHPKQVILLKSIIHRAEFVKLRKNETRGRCDATVLLCYSKLQFKLTRSESAPPLNCRQLGKNPCLNISYHNISKPTGCSLNIVFFPYILKYSRLWLFSVFPRRQAGRKPTLQQN